MSMQINQQFMTFSKRAESNDRSWLVETFVDNGPLFTILSAGNHQIMFGRRGTGKTHVLNYLYESKIASGDCVVLIDFRTIGSSIGIYNDQHLSLAERATRLLNDTLMSIHMGLLEYFVEHAEEYNLSQSGPLLDDFAKAFNDVIIQGPTELLLQKQLGTTQDSRSAIGIELSNEPKLKTEIKDTTVNKSNESASQKYTGAEITRISFGNVGRCFSELASLMPGKRIWVLFDEWSSVPIELQPYLADLIKRTLLPIRNCSVKIAAIEQRSDFRMDLASGNIIGFELGSDISADINLDDFLVYENNSEQAYTFFKELIYKHYRASRGEKTQEIETSDELISLGFSQQPTFRELVRAAEGVPRDAINILTLAAQRAMNNKISMDFVRQAARDWYQRDKEKNARSNYEAHRLLRWIIDAVIGERKARAFLLNNDVNSPLVDFLFDERVIHILKRNISSKGESGVRYNAFKLDYGCYVDLIATSNAVDEVDEDLLAPVPKDDYRAIRRAILKLEPFFSVINKSS